MLKHTNWALRICLLSFITLVSVMNVKAQITFNASNKSIKEVIEMIEEKADYSFFYSDELSDLNRKVNLSFHDENIENVLRTLFKGTNIVYKIEGDKQVVLSLQSTLKKAKSNKSVSGKIVDTEGNPLIGVSIAVDNGTRGTMSDVDGNWKLEAPKGSLLTFSYIGYNTHTLRVGSKDVYTVSMSEDNQLLDEVVVIGYGTMKKRDLTGAISSVKSEDIKMAPVANAMEALQGKVAGLDISRSSGRAGESPSVLLRGNRSLTAKQDPLYIIDGIAGSIETLNPNDIESIEVMKDASSTAIYGSAGANGVILVTTKQATQGKIQVDFDAYYGVNTSPQYPSALKGQDWLDYLEEGYLASTGSHSADQSTLLAAYGLNAEAVLPYIQNNKWIDWVDETLRTGTSQN